MYGLLVIAVLTAFALRAFQANTEGPEDAPHKIGNKITQLWAIAHHGLREVVLFVCPFLFQIGDTVSVCSVLRDGLVSRRRC